MEHRQPNHALRLLLHPAQEVQGLYWVQMGKKEEKEGSLKLSDYADEGVSLSS